MSQPARSGVGGVAFWGGFPLILDEGGGGEKRREKLIN